MSSFNFIFCLFLSAAMTGCGFQPLNQVESTQSHPELGLIKISMIENREGQILRNYLLDIINPYGEPKDPSYRLHVDLNISGADFGFRRDSTASRTIVTSQAKIKLIDVKSKKILYEDIAEATTAYTVGAHISSSAFPTIVAEKKEIERGMELLSQEIKLQILSFFASEKTL